MDITLLSRIFTIAGLLFLAVGWFFSFREHHSAAITLMFIAVVLCCVGMLLSVGLRLLG